MEEGRDRGGERRREGKGGRRRDIHRMRWGRGRAGEVGGERGAEDVGRADGEGEGERERGR